jgi:hypothetical protein
MDENTIDDLVDERREKRLAWVNSLKDEAQKKAWMAFYAIYYRSEEAAKFHREMVMVHGK